MISEASDYLPASKAMPANLTQQYHKAEQAYRQAGTPQEELECLQIMLVELPKHKGTDKMQAELKQKISRVKKEISDGVGKGSNRGLSTKIPRQGAGRAIIVGAPNSGKSQLLASITKAKPNIAEYPFSTTQPLPGMMPWEDVYVQLIDTPPITKDVFDPVTQSLIRGAELIVLMLNLGSDEGGDELMELVQSVNATKSRLGTETTFDAEDIGVTYTETLLVLNKIDLNEADDRMQFFSEFVDLEFEQFKISALEGTGLDALKDRIYSAMDVVRVYTKLPTKKEPDMDAPFTLKNGQSLADLALVVHRDIANNLKGARVWGSQVHDGTNVKPDYVLNDKDIVELHTGG